MCSATAITRGVTRAHTHDTRVSDENRVRNTDVMSGRVRRATGGTLPTWSTVGSLAAFAWLAELRLPTPTTRWFVEIALDVAPQLADPSCDESTATRFHLNLYAEEWGLFFCHASRVSWIRVTDIAFAHALRDDYGLLARQPELANIAELVRSLEREHGLQFRRELAYVGSDLGDDAVTAIRAWLVRA